MMSIVKIDNNSILVEPMKSKNDAYIMRSIKWSIKHDEGQYKRQLKLRLEISNSSLLSTQCSWSCT